MTINKAVNKCKDFFTAVYKAPFLCSVLINSIAWIFFTFILKAGFETNDDIIMSNLAAGIYGEYSSYLVFINVILGKFLTFLYGAVPSLNWYVILESLIIFVSFVIITYVFMKKISGLRGIALSTVFLLFIGFECYTRMQFTKTAGLTVCAGCLLGFYYIQEQKSIWHLLTAGLMVALGSMIRFQTLLMGGLLLSGVAVFNSFQFWSKDKKKAGIVFGKYLTFAVVLCVICFGLKWIDTYIYQSQEGWKEFLEYNSLRSQVMDYGIPEWDEYQDEYAEIGLTENDIMCLKSWNFSDSEVFSADVFQKIIQLRETSGYNAISLGGFFSVYPLKFITMNSFYGFAIIALFSGVLLKRIGLKAFLYEMVCVFLMYGYLYYKGRYQSINRVDVVIWLFATSMLCYVGKEKEESPDNLRGLCGALIVSAVLFNLNPYYDNFISGIEKNKETDEQLREFNEMLVKDTKSLYTQEEGTSLLPYGFFENVPKGLYINRISLGGWTTNLPTVDYVVKRYQIENSWKAMVLNPNVYLISKGSGVNIWRYLKEHYAEDLVMSCVKDMFGYKVYKFIDGEIGVDDEKIIDYEDEQMGAVGFTVHPSENQVSLNGYAYLFARSSFQQNVYIKVKDVKSEKESWFIATKYYADFLEDVDDYYGRYGAFNVDLNLEDIGIGEKEVEIVVEADGNFYKMQTEKLMIDEQ